MPTSILCVTGCGLDTAEATLLKLGHYVAATTPCRLTAGHFGVLDSYRINCIHDLGCPWFLKQDGRTPLHVACEHGNMEAAAALIGLGGADLSLRDNSGLTPLHVAVDKNHLLLAKTLMDRGAAVDTTTNVSATVTRAVLPPPKSIQTA